MKYSFIIVIISIILFNINAAVPKQYTDEAQNWNWPNNVKHCPEYRKAYMIQQASFCSTAGVSFIVPADKTSKADIKHKSIVKCYCQGPINKPNTIPTTTQYIPPTRKPKRNDSIFNLNINDLFNDPIRFNDSTEPDVYGTALCFGVNSDADYDDTKNNAIIDDGAKIIVIMPSNQQTDSLLNLEKFTYNYNTKAELPGFDGAKVQGKVYGFLKKYLVPFLSKVPQIQTYGAFFLGHGYGAALARVSAHYLKGTYPTKKVNLFTEGEPASIMYKDKNNKILSYLSELDTDIRSTIFVRMSGSSSCYSTDIVACKKNDAINWHAGDEAPNWDIGFQHVANSTYMYAYNLSSRTGNSVYNFHSCSKNDRNEYYSEKDTNTVPEFDTSISCGGYNIHSFVHNVYQYMGMIANCNCGLDYTIYNDDIGAKQIF